MLDAYFYVQDLQSKEDRHHVQEHLATSGDKPNFIYDPSYPNGRLVEFYADWCPHCKHFKPKYIEFSIKLYEMAEKMNVKVETFAVSCVPNKVICKDQEIHGYPTMKFFAANSVNGTDISPWKLHPHEILRMVGVTVPEEQQQQQGAAAAVDTNTQKEEKIPPKDKAEHNDPQHMRKRKEPQSQQINEKKTPHFLHRNKMDTFQDAQLSFAFAMKTAIYTSDGPLSSDKQNALRPFLLILQKTMPVYSQIQPLLHDLVENFDTIAKGDDELTTILNKHPSPFKSWSKSSTQHGTGYTAGLWTLFHMMSVGLVEWNEMALDEEQMLVPAEVADSLRNYIQHFFQCEVCRLNFLSEYDACSFDRCNRLIDHQKGTLDEYVQFPLWLFETHNSVNTRLRKERIQLYDEPESLTTEADVMWPPISECPACWQSEGHHQWNEHSVFQFLHETYWPDGDSGVLRKLNANNGNDGGGQYGHAGRPFEEREEAGVQVPRVIIGCCLLATTVIVLMLWQRKRQFDRKGFHKKTEV